MFSSYDVSIRPSVPSISPNMGLDSRDNAGFAERGSISLRAKATENMKARAQAAAHPHDEGHKV